MRTKNEVYLQSLASNLSGNLMDIMYDAMEQYAKEYHENELGKISYCICEKPDREAGFSYCNKCRLHCSNERIEELTKDKCEHNVTSSWGRLVTCTVCGDEWIKEEE